MGFVDSPLKGTKAHPEHPIQLTSVDKPFECDGCYEPGSGLCYRCKEPSGKCRAIFHEECAQADNITTHPFCKGCLFTFVRPQFLTSTVDRICCVCCSDIQGFHYLCNTETHQGKGHFIHPLCMKLKSRMDLGGLQFQLKDTAPEKCGVCRHIRACDEMKGWSYVSTCGRHSLHIKCVLYAKTSNIVSDNGKNTSSGQDSLNSSGAAASTSATSPPPSRSLTLIVAKDPKGRKRQLFDKFKEPLAKLTSISFNSSCLQFNILQRSHR